jgi:hypothetical protein
MRILPVNLKISVRIAVWIIERLYSEKSHLSIKTDNYLLKAQIMIKREDPDGIHACRNALAAL